MSFEFLDTGMISLISGTTLARWRAVDIDGSGHVIYPTGSGGRVIGVVQQPITVLGNVAPILLLGNGVSMVESGAAVTQGASVGTDSSGRAVTGHGLGVALEASSASGVIIAVLLLAQVLS